MFFRLAPVARVYRMSGSETRTNPTMGYHDVMPDEEIAGIIAGLSEGLTLKASCERAGRAYAHVVRRIRASEELTQLHAHARAEYAHLQVQKMHEIARDEPDVQRARLMIDCIKWEAARVLPKDYGDKVTHAGDAENPIPHVISWDAGQWNESSGS